MVHSERSLSSRGFYVRSVCAGDPNTEFSCNVSFMEDVPDYKARGSDEHFLLFVGEFSSSVYTRYTRGLILLADNANASVLIPDKHFQRVGVFTIESFRDEEWEILAKVRRHEVTIV